MKHLNQANTEIGIGWGSNRILLSDADKDSIYSVTVPGFTVGTTIQFKFRIDGAWNGKEEFPGGGPNRVYQVRPDSNIIMVWYNDVALQTGQPVAAFTPSVSQFFENGTVLFRNHSSGRVTDWLWTFEGRTPAFSTEREPVVAYAHAGVFDVTLIASNGELSDTLTL